ncbi:hypothetical protein [Chryseobacterium wangxinyae]|uniref:hypothetical protein n=1 Tax=Chryseobacterium sp. CY353 TaxID=2997334 RepID=UPI00226DCA89|nr:hypothetical protein [Chryseobacterium sp. CY353]MCY0969782.1 hypothetical protein [Chryseobacterium sp. CY353]
MKAKWGISFLVMLSALAFLTINSYKNRIYDWDLPGYLACLYSLDYPNSSEKVHFLTYRSIKKEASAQQYKDISGLVIPNKAIQFFEKNAQGLEEQIPYYKIKVGYNFVVSIFYSLGVSGPHSVLLVSIFSYFFSGVVLFCIFKVIFPENYILAPLLTLGILLLPTARFMSKSPSPDMLGFVFLLLFILAIIKKLNQWIIFSVLLITVLIRPDYIIFALTYLFMQIVFKFIKLNKNIDLSSIFQGLLLAGIYLCIVNYYEYPGWKDLFYDTFIQRRPLITAHLANFSFNDYLNILFNKLINFKKVSLASTAILGMIFYFSRNLWVRMISVFLFANIFIKFLIFPDSASVRFFFGFIILLFVVLMYSLSERYNGFKLNRN